jgi:predicted Holliday junction resolvase-like endonuclease
VEQDARAALQLDVLKFKQDLSNAAAEVENERVEAAKARTVAEKAEQRVAEAKAATDAMKEELAKVRESGLALLHGLASVYGFAA